MENNNNSNIGGGNKITPTEKPVTNKKPEPSFEEKLQSTMGIKQPTLNKNVSDKGLDAKNKTETVIVGSNDNSANNKETIQQEAQSKDKNVVAHQLDPTIKGDNVTENETKNPDLDKPAKETNFENKLQKTMGIENPGEVSDSSWEHDDEYDQDYERSWGPKPEPDDDDVDNSVSNKVKVSSYYDDKYRGLEGDQEFDSEDEAISHAWDKLQKGNYVDINGTRISPDDIDWESDTAFEQLQDKINSAKQSSNSEEFVLDKEKYPDVKETSYGYVYNVNDHSITDLGREARENGHYKDGNNYGFSVEINGDEYVFDTFEEAYKFAKKGYYSREFNTTPEQDEILNKLFNHVFGSDDWNTTMDSMPYGDWVKKEIGDFLKTGDQSRLLYVLNYVHNYMLNSYR